MSNLILLTNSFPYGNWEPYLETEVNYYTDFEQIHICSLQIRKKHMEKVRELPFSNMQNCPVQYASKFTYLLNAASALVDRNFYGEVGRLIKKHCFSLKRFEKLVIFISRSHYEARVILKYLKKSGIVRTGLENESEGVLYAYRFEYQPYVGILLQKHLPNYKLVSRAHRFDLYEEERDVGYIPMREFLLSKLDKIILIADDGKKYLERKYPGYKHKLVVSRLGTVDHSVKKVRCAKETINIVSCSTVYPIKRVDMIVKALSQVHEVNVNWTHYGDGVQLDLIKSLCADILPLNIQYEFRGFVDNSKVLEEYGERNYHLFLNVSESEGIPVSIMEALSFGIPCIATNVGGTSEIIENKKNGILLKKDFAIEDLTDWIVKFAVMNDEEYQFYRLNARRSWEEKYNADKNYKEFIESLKLLLQRN